jgi:hypothetical protein
LVSIEPSWKTDSDPRCLHRNPLSLKFLHACEQKGGVLIGKSVVSQAQS